MRLSALLLSCSLLSLPISLPVWAETVIHVSPTGSDTGDGTAQKPFRTLPRTQTAVRKANAKDDVVVVLGDGTYALNAPLVFTAADGGKNGHSVTWRAAEGATPLISGGFTVTGFTLVDADKRLYVANVPKGTDARQLWVDDVLAERPFIEIKPEDLEYSATGFTIKNPKLAYIADLKHPARLEVEATGIFTDRYAPVKSIDGQVVTMQQPAWDNNTWGYDTLTKPFFANESHLFLVNAPEFFGKVNQWHSRPYQWFVSPEEGKLYLRAALDADVAKLTVTLPRLEVLISISGTVDKPVENLTFEGLRFSYTSWMGPSQPTGYANQQSGAFLKEVSPVRPSEAWKVCGWGCADFERMRLKWNQIPAAIQVSAARNITFARNTFSQLGQVGLGIGNDANAHLSGVGLATQNIRVTRNRFAVLSGSAIMAGGIQTPAHHPDDPRLISQNLVIEDNWITTVSQDYKDNAAVLTTYIDGAQIRHNDISDAPYDAIAVGWGWGYNDAGGNPNYDKKQKGYLHNPVFDTPTTLKNTVIEGNRIHGVKQWYMDGGAIYNLSANPNAVIRNNYIADINNKVALYLDEGSKHFLIENNVVDTQGMWLNINTAGKEYLKRISSNNTARHNWHNSIKTGGRWLKEIDNVADDNYLLPDKNWPPEAQAVIRNAGVRPE
ncbi:right-handed parallel beta-helix repeat-containing protein [Asticcacaulis sp. BYS171W]|uniref:Right-handed parallel beta-helix repeat-containing protein n=1 Tax=Asticcacaulis aquaticus TaxID=2984212 RepID=A0ABT5HVQ3_9CAUL|nr:right-handed parallel beta-helix repeat-containing protein [Asticcacaulis aquaticus]MDC7684150.1 right-handed parallel beta-helix repeat-containing protein [Asticcacaulis aquaticus]